MHAEINFDGSSSPKKKDKAGCGFYIKMEDREIAGNIPLPPESTNNYAEYQGLIHGLEEALRQGIKTVYIRGDSQLIIYQVTGKYKVKKDELKPLREKVIMLLAQFDEWKIEWVRREDNTIADRMSRSEAT